MAILDGPGRRLMEPLKGGLGMARAELAMAAGYQPNTGTVNSYLSKLRSLGLIVPDSAGRVQPSTWLFL